MGERDRSTARGQNMISRPPALLRLQCHQRLEFLSSDQKAKLSKHFTDPDKTATAHQLAALLDLNYARALEILVILEAEKLCQNQLLIYHQCKPNVPVAAIPYGEGFPNLPWSCPACEKEVKNYDELFFDILAQAKDSIEFV